MHVFKLMKCFCLIVLYCHFIILFNLKLEEVDAKTKYPGKEKAGPETRTGLYFNYLDSAYKFKAAFIERTASADFSNAAFSASLRRRLMIFSQPLRPKTTGTPMQISF